MQLHTNAIGKGDQVGQPEGHPLPLQLHAVEHDACSNHADDDGQQELLQHLVAEVGDDAVQAIIAFPARQLQGSGRLQWHQRRCRALQEKPLAKLQSQHVKLCCNIGGNECLEGRPESRIAKALM